MGRPDMSVSSRVDRKVKELQDWLYRPQVLDQSLITQAHHVIGVLSAASALMDQGCHVPARWLGDQMDWADNLLETA
jgi:hypothetical protein